MYILRYAEGGEEKKIEVNETELLLGRAPDCTLVLAQPGISRHHCKIIQDGKKVNIIDLKSKNGTRVNNIYIKTASLSSRDIITVAEFAIRFEVPAPTLNKPIQPEEDTDQLVLLSENKELHEEAGTIIREVSDLQEIIAQYDQEQKVQETQDAPRDLRRIMTVIIEVAKALIAVKSLDEVINRLMDLIFENLPADRGFLMLLGENGVLDARVCKYRNPAESETIEISSTIANKALNDKCAILTTDAQVDPRFKAGESIRFLGIKSAMCVPLFHKKKSIGIIYLDCPTSAAIFSATDLDLLTAMANFAAVGVEQAQLSERIIEEQSVRQRLERYHSPAIVERILKNLSTGHGDTNLHAEVRDVSILFADIVGFTPFSERTEPAEIADLLNEYFSEMTDIIFKFEGTLDKYIGDAIMAVFGAPNHMEDHAFRAVSTGLEMLERLERLNQRRSEDRRFRIRIGINTGNAVAGDIGSIKRMEYTVLGNTVNVAARIESMACQPLQVVVGESTYQIVKDHFVCRPLGPIRLKGISEETNVYHVQGKLSQ